MFKSYRGSSHRDRQDQRPGCGHDRPSLPVGMFPLTIDDGAVTAEPVRDASVRMR
jgi:hypothetical protein